VEGYNFERECPVCHEPAYRVRRRLIDRVRSWFVHCHRYRCLSLSCGWEGTLPIASRKKATPSQSGGGPTSDQ